jgi:hypothetical protein
MPGNPKECRENAKRCFEFAQTARTEADRERFEGLAKRWLALATDFEAASALMGKWSHGPMTFADWRVPNREAPMQSGGSPKPEQPSETTPSQTHPTYTS